MDARRLRCDDELMDAERQDPVGQRTSTLQKVRIVLLLVVAAVLVAWALANTEEVAVDWLVDTTTGPLVVVIAISAGLGFLLGAVTMWRQGR